jgi:hypothetical protein
MDERSRMREDWLLTKEAAFWLCILVAIALSFFAGYMSGEAR